MAIPMREPVIEIPNCDDPVFRMWCDLCRIVPGQRIDSRDWRLAQLQHLMNAHGDPCYDPEADPDDDYLTRGF